MTREHHGMKFMPEGAFRKPGSTDKPPTWWEIYYRDPELGGRAVLLGRSERQRRHQEHRFYSIYGDYQNIVGWVVGVEWLIECHRSARARRETVKFMETESVKKQTIQAKIARLPELK